MTSTDEQLFALATANRLLAADMFAGLTEEQWATPSLCGGWTVREVAAHLQPAGDLKPWKFALSLIRYRGDFNRLVDQTARTDAKQPVADLVRGLRDDAGTQLKFPVVGAGGPMSDTALHLRDAARPLGLDVGPQPAAWVPVLDFLVSKPAARGFVAKGRLAGLHLAATDQAWTWGEGLEVTGTCEALAMAMAGRAAALPDLSGPGVATLTQRLARH